jgi:methyltransferase (TIGR00027 family)
MTDSPIGNLSDSAFLIAMFRALEDDQRNPLFCDPLARRLAGEHGKRMVEGLPKEAFLSGWMVAIRTYIIDDLIRQAVADGVDTVVNLGAGLDTRPYRMDLPQSIRWIEVDYPNVIEFKEGRLSEEKPRFQLERMTFDLADMLARRKCFVQIEAQSTSALILTEGVLPYLRTEEVSSLAEELASHVPFKSWIVDYFSPEIYRYRQQLDAKQPVKGELVRFCPDDYFRFFGSLGWLPKEIRYIGEEAKRLKRSMPSPRRAPWWSRLLGFLAAARRERSFRRSAGYVLFNRDPKGPKED